MTIGEKIYTIMRENNLTQKQFAEKIGASQASVNYWVNGDREPKLAHLRKIADTFNINISELLGLPLKKESININDSIIIDDEDTTKAIKKIFQNQTLAKEVCSVKREKILILFDELNNNGKDKAIEQVEMLTKIQEYTEEDE